MDAGATEHQDGTALAKARADFVEKWKTSQVEPYDVLLAYYTTTPSSSAIGGASAGLAARRSQQSCVR